MFHRWRVLKSIWINSEYLLAQDLRPIGSPCSYSHPLSDALRIWLLEAYQKLTLSLYAKLPGLPGLVYNIDYISDLSTTSAPQSVCIVTICYHLKYIAYINVNTFMFDMYEDL
jgi:hypothetical protein